MSAADYCRICHEPLSSTDDAICDWHLDYEKAREGYGGDMRGGGDKIPITERVPYSPRDRAYATLCAKVAAS